MFCEGTNPPDSLRNARKAVWDVYSERATWRRNPEKNERSLRTISQNGIDVLLENVVSRSFGNVCIHKVCQTCVTLLLCYRQRRFCVFVFVSKPIHLLSSASAISTIPLHVSLMTVTTPKPPRADARQVCPDMSHLLFISVSSYLAGPQCKSAAKADFILLVDGSWSIGRLNFKTIRSFIARMVGVFDVSPERVQIGAFGLTYHAALPRHDLKPFQHCI